MVLAVIIGIGFPINVAPNPVWEIGVDVQVFQLFSGRIPGSGLSFAENCTSHPIAFDRLVFHLFTLADHLAFENFGPFLALGGCVDLNAFPVQRTDLNEEKSYHQEKKWSYFSDDSKQQRKL